MFKKNNIPWNKGRKWDKETKSKISIAAKERFRKNPELLKKQSISIKTYWKEHPERLKRMNMLKRGHVSFRKGVSMIEEFGEEKARKISQKISNTLRKNKKTIKQHDSLLFNNVIKTRVKERDGHTCQLCKRYSPILQIHHIDFDKSNNMLKNLVSLCPECHGRTNGIAWWKYKIVFETGMYRFAHFIPEKSKLWLKEEYDNFISKIYNPFGGVVHG